LIASLILPFSISSISNGWTFGSFWCNMSMGLLIMEQLTKAFVLVLLDFILIAQHQGHIYTLSNFKAFILFAFCWASGVLTALFFISLVSFGHKCDIFWPEFSNTSFSEAFTFTYTICYFIFPVAVLYLLYKQSRKEPFENTQESFEMIRMALYLTIAHVALSSGHMLAQWIFTFHKIPSGIAEPEWKVNLALLTGLIWQTIAVVFPLIYYRYWPEFQKAVTDVIMDTLEYRPLARFENNKVPY
jgi:membrane protein